MVEHITGALEILPITGLPELRPGDDLADLLCGAAPWLRDGDILVVTSKVVSKVEGRLISVPTDPEGRERARQAAIAEQTARVVAERGATKIVATHHGWVMAAAGVDGSNVASGELALLPVDSDASARHLRAAVLSKTGASIAVVVSDTNGRTWRRGVVDVAIGVAGMASVVDLRGQPDTSGIDLEVTEIAVADELASAADLVKGKLSGLPAAVIRGLAAPVDDDRGAAALRRPIAEDMFTLGTRDVVRSRRTPAEFGAGPIPAPVLRSAIKAAMAAMAATSTSETAENNETTASSIGLQLLLDNPWRATADQLLGRADAVIVPVLPDQADEEAITRLGMAISALLIQLHAEGLAAAWLSPTQIGDVPRLPAPDGSRPNGLVVVGQPIGQIDR